ncbi:MAG: hypothetical protein F6K00_01130 [Leptolyngbya sp. SIOISBB]|nr:hypothetical protein [Leptolyngbya sp. SIOISBB]
MADYATARQTKIYYTDELLERFPQIVSIAPQLEYEDGRLTGNSIIRIGILCTSEVELQNIGIPEYLPAISETGIAISGETVQILLDIEGPIEFLQNSARLRPCPGGFSIGNANEIGSGTFGGLVAIDGGDFDQILSNNHVIARDNAGAIGEIIIQPGSGGGDGGATPNDDIATLNRFVEVSLDLPNEVDCALATVINVNDVSRNVQNIGIPAGVSDAVVGDEVRKSGRTTMLTNGEILSTDATITVNFGGGNARFDNQLQHNLGLMDGDSGSLVFLRNSLIVVGLNFAADNTTPGIGYANKIQRVFYSLESAARTLTVDGCPVDAEAVKVSF